MVPQGALGGCGEGEEDSCYRTSCVGTDTTLAWVSHGGRGLDNLNNGVWCSHGEGHVLSQATPLFAVDCLYPGVGRGHLL